MVIVALLVGFLVWCGGIFYAVTMQLRSESLPPALQALRDRDRAMPRLAPAIAGGGLVLGLLGAGWTVANTAAFAAIGPGPMLCALGGVGTGLGAALFLGRQ